MIPCIKSQDIAVVVLLVHALRCASAALVVAAVFRVARRRIAST